MDFLELWTLIEENLVTILACIGTILTVILKPNASQSALEEKERKKKQKRLDKLQKQQSELVHQAQENAKEQSKLMEELKENA